MKHISPSVLAAMLLALVLASCYLAGALWFQNSVLESYTSVAQSHLSGSGRMAEVLARVSDFQKYKQYSTSALSSSERLYRSSSELVKIVHSNIRGLLVVLAAANAGLLVLVLVMFARLGSIKQADA